MAASTIAAQSLLTPAPAIRDAASSLSCSSSPFNVAHTVHAAPFKFQATTKSRLVVAKCSLSDQEDQLSGKAAARRQVLSGLMVAAAALVASSDLTASAASGPGINGAERTSQKADELLKAADKLNIEDAPKRFGPGIPGAAKDASKVAQKAGSGAIEDLQSGATSRQARQSVEETARRASGIFGNKQDNVGDVAGNVQQGAKNILGQVQGRNDDARSAAEDVVGQAQSKANDGGKGVLGSIQEGVQGFKESVAQKDSDAKNAAQGAATNAQKALQ